MSDSVFRVKLPGPREVTPLIRTARWGLLTVGIVYGAMRLKYLRSREVKIQEHNEAILTKRAKEYRANHARMSEESARQLAVEAGVVPKA